MTVELVLFIGLQASGKSSFYRARFAGTHDLISKDRFPNNSNPGRRQRVLIEQSLRAGRPAVVDNTNPTREERSAVIELARSLGARVIGYYFQSRLEDCVLRNRSREGKARVPDVALYATCKKLQAPSLAEGFERLSYVRLLEGSGFEILEWQEGESSDEAR